MDTGENNQTKTRTASPTFFSIKSKLSPKEVILMILALTSNNTYTLLTSFQPAAQGEIMILTLVLVLFYLTYSLLSLKSLSDQTWRIFLFLTSSISLLLYLPFPGRDLLQPIFGAYTILIESLLIPYYLKRFIDSRSKKTITIGALLTSLLMAVGYLQIKRNPFINVMIEIGLHFFRIFALSCFDSEGAAEENKNTDESFENFTLTPFLQQIKFSCIIALFMTILGIDNTSTCLIIMITLHILALIPKFTLFESIPIISSLTLTLALPIFSYFGSNDRRVHIPLLIFFIISFVKTAFQSSPSSSNQQSSSNPAKLDKKRKVNEQQVQEERIHDQKTKSSSYLAKLEQKRKLNEQQQSEEQTIPTQKTKSSSSKNTPNTFQMTPIGYVENSCYPDKFGVPRQPKLVPDSYAVIKLNPPYDQAECVRSLEVWSHVWVTFIFHESPEKWTPLIRPPRLGGNAKVGVFASRSTHRPNRLGLSLVEVVKIETEKGVKLHIKGHDLINGTPVLDVKPYIPWGDRGENARAGYALAPPEELPVIFMPEAEEVLKTRKDRDILEPLIIQVMQQDPRPAYKSEEAERRFGVYLYDLDVRFRILEEDGRKVVKVVEIVKSQFAKD